MEKFGFVYIWFDRKHKRYYVGSHWGHPDDGYICSSRWMRKSFKRRPDDFKRRIISKVFTNRKDLLVEEERWLRMMKPEEMVVGNSTEDARDSVRYYNLRRDTWEYWHTNPEGRKTIGEKISAAKKGKKTGPRDPSIGKKISEVKRAKFEARKAAGLSCYDSNDPWKGNNQGRVNSDESNRKRSESLKKAYAEGRH